MQRNCWRIKCNHTPETLDRILAPFRKRGMVVESVHYKRESDFLAACVVEFEEDEDNSSRIYKNLLRTVDILTIEVVSVENAVVNNNGQSI